MSNDRNGDCSMGQRIDSIRMRESERRIARAHMHDADVVAGLFGRVPALLRSGREALVSVFAQRAR